MNLSEDDIEKANREVEKAKRASEFTKEDYERVKKNMLTTLSAVPAGKVPSVLANITRYMNSSSWDDIGTASAEVLENSMKDWVKETASGFLNEAGQLGKNVSVSHKAAERLLSIEKFCQMMVDEHARTKQKWKDIADGANAKRLLNEFYYKLQREIESYKRESDEIGWQINFSDAAVGRNFTFYGVDSNYQTWFVDIRMGQMSTNEFGSVAGSYEGIFSMSAEHEMSNFELRAHEAILNMGEVGTAIRKMKETPGYTVNLKTVSPGSAYISRTISGTCTAVIKENGEIILSLEEEKDETSVIISEMEVEMDYSLAGSQIFKAGGKIDFQIWANKEEIEIGGVNANIFLESPDVDFSHDISGSGSVKVGWDKEIWKHWDDAEKKLEYANR